ncbi:MAG TPA: hypothetical protein VFQ35_00590 [Polyangiaceae bacterium]|nr:hypothetical protein [Polyangiaceae bacterium]
MKASSVLGILLVGVCAGCSAANEEDVGSLDQAAKQTDFGVDFGSCTEVAAIGNVPRANVRPLVPAKYDLAGDAQNAVLVARAVNCGAVSVDGKAARPTTLIQIGVSLVGAAVANPVADINNYTLWYVTDNSQLFAKLNSAGANAENSQHLSYTVTSGVFDFSASPARAPAVNLHGPVTPGIFPPQLFRATWWSDGNHGTIRMHTPFPQIRFGVATTTLTTPANSDLSRVIGGTSMTFSLLDSSNTFDSARMEVVSVP